MNLYILEMIIVVILAIIVSIILKVKNVKKVGAVIGTLILILLIVFGITFLLEKPDVNITGTQMNVEVKQANSLKEPKTVYHFKDISNEVKVVGNVDFDKVGAYEVEYEVPTITGKYTVSQTVNVVDTIAPKITLEGEKIYNLSYEKEYVEPGYTVTDNYDENLTEKVQVNKEEVSENEYNLVYTVEDSSGNKASVTRKVCIIDDVAPVIKLNGEENMQILLNSEYEDKGATADDEIDGDLTSKIEIVGSVDTSKTGTYTIAYKVTDNSGNEATKVRKVTVYKKTVQAQNGTTGKKGVIYLTFDDGPTSSITPKILDILKEKNVKATFFIINYSSSNEKLVQREVAEGHTVGLHGYSHDYTRFPGGSSNTVSRYNPGIMTTLCEEVVSRGYRYFDWNISSGDAGGAKTSQEVYNNVINGLSKNRANVVLMHDFSGNTKTLNALADIIDYGLNNGYTFSNITESTPMVTHHVNN